VRAIKGWVETRGKRTKVWPRKPSSRLGQVWNLIGGNAARDWAYGSLAVEKPGPRYIHFPDVPAAGSRPIDEEFSQQLTRERLVVRRQGYTEWEKPKAAHEAGVCFVYAYAAVCGLQALSGHYVAIGKLPKAVEVPTAAPGTGILNGVEPLPAANKPERRRRLPRRVMRSRFMSSL
jgi:phage terminase large subunit GpA-like protein